MFAVVKTGGKQYKVSEGDIFRVEKLDHEAGETVTLDQVLMVGEGEEVTAGTPFLEGSTVICEVTEQFRGPKIIIFKKKRRKKYRRKNGHRQSYTNLKVTQISK